MGHHVWLSPETHTMTTNTSLTQSMKDAVEIAGGRMTREEYIASVTSLQQANGGATTADSVRVNAFKANRLAKAGLTTIKIGSQINEVWTQELADAFYAGQGTGGSAQSNFTVTAPSANFDTTQTAGDVFYGVPRRDASTYEGTTAHQHLISNPTGYQIQNSEFEVMSFAFQLGHNMMTAGPTGCGKTMAFKEFCYQTGIPLVRANMRGDIEWADLLGYNTTNDQNELIFVDGPLTVAARYGGLFYADEFNYAKSDITGGLNMVMDSGILNVEPTGEVITVHPDFRVIGSYNPGYAGTRAINAATRRRFEANINFDYLSADLEINVIQAQSGVQNHDAAVGLVRFANAVRDLAKQREIETDLSTASLVSVMQYTQAFSIRDAMAYTLMPLFDEDEVEAVEMAARAHIADY